MEKEKLKIFGNIGSRQHQTNGDERKKLKRVFQENDKSTWKQTIEQKSVLSPLVRNSEMSLKWTKEKLKQIDQRTRKFMTRQKALNIKKDLTDDMCQ